MKRDGRSVKLTGTDLFRVRPLQDYVPARLRTAAAVTSSKPHYRARRDGRRRVYVRYGPPGATGGPFEPARRARGEAARYLGRQRGNDRVSEIFDADGSCPGARERVMSWQEGMHRYSLAPYDGDRLDMLRFVRETMAMHDWRLGQTSEWVAVIHSKPDAAHPHGNRHAHVYVRANVPASEKEMGGCASAAATDQLGRVREREFDRMYEAHERTRGRGRTRERDHGE